MFQLDWMNILATGIISLVSVITGFLLEQLAKPRPKIYIRVQSFNLPKGSTPALVILLRNRTHDPLKVSDMRIHFYPSRLPVRPAHHFHLRQHITPPTSHATGQNLLIVTVANRLSPEILTGETAVPPRDEAAFIFRMDALFPEFLSRSHWRVSVHLEFTNDTSSKASAFIATAQATGPTQ